MPKYLTGQELLQRWDIEGFELYHIIRHENLMPFDNTGRPVFHPDQQARLNYLQAWEDELRKLRKALLYQPNDGERRKRIVELKEKILEFKRTHRHSGDLGWSLFPIPESRDELAKLISILTRSLFSIQDVENFEQDEELIRYYEIRIPKTISSPKLKRKGINFNDSNSENASLLRKIGTEAESIYKYMVDKVGVTDKTLRSRLERKEAALLFLEKNKNKFFYISEKHLEDLDVFDFKSNQAKRDYMRRLLKIVFETIYPGNKYSGAKLFDSYKRLE